MPSISVSLRNDLSVAWCSELFRSLLGVDIQAASSFLSIVHPNDQLDTHFLLQSFLRSSDTVLHIDNRIVSTRHPSVLSISWTVLRDSSSSNGGGIIKLYGRNVTKQRGVEELIVDIGTRIYPSKVSAIAAHLHGGCQALGTHVAFMAQFLKPLCSPDQPYPQPHGLRLIGTHLDHAALTQSIKNVVSQEQAASAISSLEQSFQPSSRYDLTQTHCACLTRHALEHLSDASLSPISPPSPADRDRASAASSTSTSTSSSPVSASLSASASFPLASRAVSNPSRCHCSFRGDGCAAFSSSFSPNQQIIPSAVFGDAFHVSSYWNFPLYEENHLWGVLSFCCLSLPNQQSTPSAAGFVHPLGYNLRSQLAYLSRSLMLHMALHREDDINNLLPHFVRMSPDLMSVCSDRNPVYVNSAWTRSLGWTSDELLQLRSLDELVHPEDLELSREHLKEIRTTGTNSGFRCRYRHRDGSFVCFDWRGVFDPVQKRLITVGRDATKELKQEADLQAALRGAEEASRVKSTFLANMSHEIRTPMNGVKGMAALLSQTPLTSEQEDYVKSIMVSTDHLLTVINDILDLSKIESGQSTLESIPIDLFQCIEHAFDLAARPSGDQQELLSMYTVEPSVPVCIMGDATRLRQIITNLLGNAFKFTPAPGEVILSVRRVRGSPSPTARRRLTSDRTTFQTSAESNVHEEIELEFCCRDTGRGISQENQAKLFRPFSQAEPSIYREYGGSGLGLAISSRLCRLMGGRMWVESKEGAGSAFYFTIRTTSPLRPSFPSPPSFANSDLSPTSSNHSGMVTTPDMSPNVLPSRPTESGASPRPFALPAALPLLNPFVMTTGSLKDLRVLLVDPHPTSLRLLSENLSNWGCVVQSAPSVEQALVQLQGLCSASSLDSQPPLDPMSFRIDVVFLDSDIGRMEISEGELPPLDTLLDLARRANPTLSVVWLTSSNSAANFLVSPSASVSTTTLLNRQRHPSISRISTGPRSVKDESLSISPSVSPVLRRRPLAGREMSSRAFSVVSKLGGKDKDKESTVPPSRSSTDLSATDPAPRLPVTGLRGESSPSPIPAPDEAPSSPLRSYRSPADQAVHQALSLHSQIANEPICVLRKPLKLTRLFQHLFLHRQAPQSPISPLPHIHTRVLDTGVGAAHSAPASPTLSSSSDSTPTAVTRFIHSNRVSTLAQEFPVSVLVVEDNAINRKLILKLLEKLGYHNVSHAADGLLALEMTKRHHYDIIFMDVMMPEMDGLQSTKAIRKWYASPEGQSRLTSVQIPPVIIAMTANAMRGDKEQCLEAGMDDYISKPIDFAAVIEKLSFWGTRVAQGKSV